MDRTQLRKESWSLQICRNLAKLKSREKKGMGETPEQNIPELWDSYIRRRGLPEEEEDKGTEEIMEVIMAENFPTSVIDTKPQIKESQRTPRRINTKKIYLWACHV